MDEIGKGFSLLFDHLEIHKCLCKYNAKEIWCQIYQNNFKKKDIFGRNDDQLLCISFVRLTGEIYINAASKHHSVCKNIQQLLEVFLSEDLWNLFIYHLKHSKDKYLVFTFIKAFSIMLYASSESTFSERINELLNDTKENIFEETNINVLDFLSNLVGYNFKPLGTDENNVCNNVVSNLVFPFSDLFQSLCVILSHHWGSFMSQFCDVTSSRTENRNLSTFLLLWQKIISRHTYLREDLFLVYLNEQFVIAFLSNAYNMGVVPLRIYADIIMQFYNSSLKIKPSQTNCSSLEEAVVSALDKKFLDLLPCNIQISGFCILTSSKDNKSCPNTVSDCLQKCDTVIVKKVTFIFLNIITGLKNKQFLNDAVIKVLNFVKENFNISSEEPVYRWILDIFIDQDDFLFEIMFALLRIYIILRKDNTINFPDCTQLQNSLNPHEVFISFLQRIGFDYNELLSFLTSDETCFLLYILQYLKLLLKESDIFIKAHRSLIKAEEFGCGLGESSDEPPAKKLLVSYSSSSSDEDSTCTSKTKNRTIFPKNNLIVMKTLVKLKQAIGKLVEAGEFPYNISPLVVLLQTCENRCLS